MSDTYEINESNQVVPYTSGRKCTDTRAWRDATDLELQQQEQIEQLERELAEAREDAMDHKRMLQSLSKTQALDRAELDRSFQHIMKQRDTLAEALYSIRHRLGDFQEPWNSRETDIDSIAHQAIAAVKGGSHE